MAQMKETAFFALVTGLAKLPGVIDQSLVGSVYVLGEGADTDILVLTNDRPATSGALTSANWLRDGAASGHDQGWSSFRNGGSNVILTDDKGWFDRFKLAAEVCRALRLSDKADRIKVHRVIRDGVAADAL